MFFEPYLGNVTVFAGNFAPQNWMFCQGQLLSIQQYTPLFAIVSNIYGGDGVSTFGLPNLSGRRAIHAGQGTGLYNYALGSVGGSESLTLTQAQLPTHTHNLESITGSPGASAQPGTLNSPTSAVPAVIPNTSAYASSPGGVDLGASTNHAPTVIAGGASPIPVTSPYLVMNYVIAVLGIFPQRS
ncbi:MAG: tail fiber protein [Chitinophagaceae bacterium]